MDFRKYEISFLYTLFNDFLYKNIQYKISHVLKRILYYTIL